MKVSGCVCMLLAASACLVGAAACGSDYTQASPVSLADADSGVDGGGVPATDGGLEDGSRVDAPPGCDARAEPKNSALCVVEAVGVFVDGKHGDDSWEGSRAHPVKSIGAALSKVGARKRVYICGGTYAESVKLTSAISLYGGFGCGDWTYTGERAKVAPTAPGYALAIEGVTGGIEISDIEASSVDGTAGHASSMAAFVTGSQVVFRRVKLAAGAGHAGAAGAAGGQAALTSNGNLNGNPASGAVPGASKTCTYSAGAGSTGGSGGGGNTDGGKGGPNLNGTPPKDGAGGTGGTGDCNLNGNGHTGATGHAGEPGKSASRVGQVSNGAWVAADGEDGTSGGPGQGGGGAGGVDQNNAGGGGGCGGAPGLGGTAGRGGGASVAIFATDSIVNILTSELVSGTGGTGGTGGGGGPGGNGGIGTCLGGKGGQGGSGGGGSGGAGGISAGVLYSGTKPTADDATTITPGSAGTGGAGGASNAGPNGKSDKFLDASSL